MAVKAELNSFRLTKESFKLQNIPGVVGWAERAINKDRILQTNKDKITAQVQFLRSYLRNANVYGLPFVPQEDSHEIEEPPLEVNNLLQEGKGVFFFSEITNPVIHIGGEKIVKEGNFFALHVFVPGLDGTWAEENIFLLSNYSSGLKEQLQKVLLEKREVLDSQREGENIISFNAKVDVMDSPSHILANSFLESVGWQMIVPEHKNEFPEFIRQIYALDVVRQKTHANDAKFFILRPQYIGNQPYVYDEILMAKVLLNSSAKDQSLLNRNRERDAKILALQQAGKTGAVVSGLGLSARTAEKHVDPHVVIEPAMVMPDGSVVKPSLILPLTPEVAQFLNSNTEMTLDQAKDLIKRLAPDAYQEIFGPPTEIPKTHNLTPPLDVHPVLPVTFNTPPPEYFRGGGFMGGNILPNGENLSVVSAMINGSVIIIPAVLTTHILSGNLVLPLIPVPSSVLSEELILGVHEVDLDEGLNFSEIAQNNAEELDVEKPNDHISSVSFSDFPIEPIPGDDSCGGGGKALPNSTTNWQEMKIRYEEIQKRMDNFQQDRVVSSTLLKNKPENFSTPVDIVKYDVAVYQEAVNDEKFVIFSSNMEVNNPAKEEINNPLFIATPVEQITTIDNLETETILQTTLEEKTDEEATVVNGQIFNEKVEFHQVTLHREAETEEFIEPVISQKVLPLLSNEIAQLYGILLGLESVKSGESPSGPLSMPSWLAQMFLQQKNLDLANLNMEESYSDKTFAQRVEGNDPQRQQQTSVVTLLKTRVNPSFINLLLITKMRLLINLTQKIQLEQLLVTDTLLLFLIKPELFLVKNLITKNV